MKRLLPLLCACILAGCASSSSFQTISTTPAAVDTGKKGSVDVTCALPNSGESVAALRGAVVDQLTKKAVFRAVVDKTGADYLVRVKITSLKDVGSTERLMLGALAGRASISADVEVYDRTGAFIGGMTAEGKSSGGTIFAGTTKEAIELAAGQIANYLLRYREPSKP